MPDDEARNKLVAALLSKYVTGAQTFPGLRKYFPFEGGEGRNTMLPRWLMDARDSAMSIVPSEAALAANFIVPGGPRPIVDVFHGTTADVSQGLRPMARRAEQRPAISFATTEPQAQAFARNELGLRTPSGSVQRARLNTEGFPEVNWKEFSGQERWNPRDWDRLLNELHEAGHPGALVRGMSDAGGSAPQYVVLDPSAIVKPESR